MRRLRLSAGEVSEMRRMFAAGPPHRRPDPGARCPPHRRRGYRAPPDLPRCSRRPLGDYPDGPPPERRGGRGVMGAPDQRVRAAQAVGHCPCARVLDDNAGVELDVAAARHATLHLTVPQEGCTPPEPHTPPEGRASHTELRPSINIIYPRLGGLTQSGLCVSPVPAQLWRWVPVRERKTPRALLTHAPLESHTATGRFPSVYSCGW